MKLRSCLLGVAVLSFVIVTFGCKSAPSQRPVKAGPVDTGAGTLTQARKFLEGRWTLESFDVYPPGGPAITLKGNGTLTYDEFSNLRIEIRADQASSDLLRAAGIEIRDGVISSDGRTAVDLQNHTLTYIVAGQTNSAGPLALTRPRHWEVQGDLLTLTTQDDSGKPLSVGRWRKTP
jgi:hypothetical protein